MDQSNHTNELFNNKKRQEERERKKSQRAAKRAERQDTRELRLQAKIRGMKLDKFREQRDHFRNTFYVEQEAKLNNSALTVELPADCKYDGESTIKAWEGSYSSLVSMVNAVYQDVPKSRKVMGQIYSAVNDTSLSLTDGAILRISGNSLQLVGVHSNRYGKAVESIGEEGTAIASAETPRDSATIIEADGTVRPYEKPRTQPSLPETIAAVEDAVKHWGPAVDLTDIPEYDPKSDGFIRKQDENGRYFWVNEDSEEG